MPLLPPHKQFPCPKCGTNKVLSYGSKQCRQCFLKRGGDPGTSISEDRAMQAARVEKAALKKKYDEALKTIERLEREAEAFAGLGDIETFTIEPKLPSGKSEGTVVMVASDWHVEENVGAEVGGLNRYNLAIARSRATQFFRNGLRLTNILSQDITISQIVLPLLGDFISGTIHEEVAEVGEVAPMLAIVEAQNMIASGIQFILDNSPYSLVLPCHSGNHGRVTKTTRFATEKGHSLEHLMYVHLAAYFRGEPRVTFLVPEGYHSYVQVYDQTIRFHHGHAVRYGGGVGGIYIPVHKAIAQWNRAKRADLDVFGHFHQQVDGGSFLCNGSMIGFNAYALSIKASYEPPKQTLVLIDKKRGRTANWPILFDKEKTA